MKASDWSGRGEYPLKMYYLDLFSGIGGFALGAYWAGLRFDAHYFSEVDDYAIRVYQQRFPDAIPLGDITKIDGRTLPASDWIIAGGFPCQDISVAGKGAGLEGERSGLWYEYARIIGELRPQYAVMENVGALTFRGLDAVLGSLAEIGYDAEWQDIRASDVGAPHRRERIWIVAYPESERFIPASNENRVGKKDVAKAFDGSNREPSVPGSVLGQNWVAPPPGYRRVDDGISALVDRLKCLGNSIVPQIAEMIFSSSVFDEWRI
jgi:DNA (cytosine-5)-methyltransferase 1